MPPTRKLLCVTTQGQQDLSILPVLPRRVCITIEASGIKKHHHRLANKLCKDGETALGRPAPSPTFQPPLCPKSTGWFSKQPSCVLEPADGQQNHTGLVPPAAQSLWLLSPARAGAGGGCRLLSLPPPRFCRPDAVPGRQRLRAPACSQAWQ